MIDVENTMTIYEIDGVEQKVGDKTKIHVRSHWNRNSLVDVVIAGKRYAVAADDLVAAIRNAQNTGTV